MARKRKGAVYVYRDRAGWRIDVRTRSGDRTSTTRKTKRGADALAASLRLEIDREEVTVSNALGLYEIDMRARGTSHGHARTTFYRLRALLEPVLDRRVDSIDEDRAKQCYRALADRVAVDTHRNTLGQARTFGRWLVSEKMADASPWADIKGIGRRSRGKQQLTIDESRALAAHCYATDTPEATSVLCCLVMGLRAGEIVLASLDDNGRLLRIAGAKTAAGDRLIEIPEPMRDRMPALVDAQIGRHKVSYWCRRMCELSGVTVVGAHSLRGTHASLATAAGATSTLVAATLGHAGTAVTEAHYTRREALDGARVRGALKVLAGGKS